MRGLYPSSRRRALEAHDPVRLRMTEAEAGGVEAQAAKGPGGAAVLAIAHDRVSHPCELNPDLTAPPRPQRQLQQRGVGSAPEHAIARDRGLPFPARGGADPETPILDEAALEAALERARLLAHLPLHEGPVHAQHRARLELGLQVRLRRGRLGEDEEARGLAVETMDDEGPRP